MNTLYVDLFSKYCARAGMQAIFDVRLIWSNLLSERSLTVYLHSVAILALLLVSLKLILSHDDALKLHYSSRSSLHGDLDELQSPVTTY